MKAAVVIVSACGGSGESPANPADSPPSLAAASSPSLTAEAGATLVNSLRVRVMRGAIAAIDFPVAWTSNDGSTIMPAISRTNADGVATASWTVGTTIRTIRATASIGNGATEEVEFSAAVTAGPPASLAPVDAPNLAGIRGVNMADALRVVVRDAYANPVSGARVSWTVVSGSATPTPAVTSADATGIARASVNIPEVGTSVIRAILMEVPALTTELTINSLGAPTAEVDVTVANNSFHPVSALSPVNGLIRWTLRNTSGVAHFIVSSGTPSFASPLNALTGDGTSFQFVFSVPGTYRYECTLHAGMTGSIVVQ